MPCIHVPFSLQAPRAPREECQAFPGVMGRKDHLAPLVSVETKENLVKEALQVSKVGKAGSGNMDTVSMRLSHEV